MKSIKYILATFLLLGAFSSNSQTFHYAATNDWVYPSYTTVKIQTENKSDVWVQQWTANDWTQNTKNHMASYYQTQYGGRLIVVSEATVKYNCHAWAWANITTSWMDTPNEKTYWLDNSYISVSTNPSSATKMWYGPFNPSNNTGDHSSIINSSNSYTSKWGAAPLITHNYNDTPYGTATSLYKRYNPPNYYISTVIDEWGGQSTIYANGSGYASARLELFKYPTAVTPTSYVWTATLYTGQFTWNLSPSGSIVYADVMLGYGQSGCLRIVCATYNGGTLLGSSTYYLYVN